MEKYPKVTKIFLLMLSVLYFIGFYIHRKKQKYFIKESKKNNIQNSLWGEGEDESFLDSSVLNRKTIFQVINS